MFEKTSLLKKPGEQEILNEYGVHDIVVPKEMVGLLRSDHAGETGAVWIYKAASLAFWSDAIREMSLEHLPTEQNHLVVMEHLVLASQRSKLIFIWKIMGFGLGFLSALFGYYTFCVTINAVETFVESHYMDQIIKLKKMGNNQNLLKVLKRCCDEEIHHQEDAGRRIKNGSISSIKKMWIGIIKIGSEFAVKVSARV